MIKITRPSCPNPTALSTNYKHPQNKMVLQKASYGKCMYCESKITHIYFGDVEHIKPKSKYPELEFEWSNLGFVCSLCNHLKSDKFDEDTQYINPYEEDPENEIVFWGSLLRPKKGSERGELTILDLGLNRPDLIEKRGIVINNIEKAINACMRSKNQALRDNALKELLLESNPDKDYSLAIKTFFKIQGIEIV
jgi:uncharacterized protein (TIGR02646 family)